MPVRVLFLDIDGTMFDRAAVPVRGPELEDQVPAFEPEAVQALNAILRRTEARVVIASDRAALGRRGIEKLLVGNGVTATLHDDWRTTPLSSSTRASEITWWLDAHPDIRSWAAIDDDPSVQRMRHAWLISRQSGLGADDVESVVGLLAEDAEAPALAGVPKTPADYDARCQAILARFPWSRPGVFGCPAGWLDLLESGLARAERRVHRDDLVGLKLRRLDVWRGTLRLDVSDEAAAPEMWRIERQSVETCAACGSPGRTRTDTEEWVTLCDQCAAGERARVMSACPSADARGAASSPAPPTVREDEVAELRERIAYVEGQPTEIRILDVARLLWSNWELDDRVAAVESVRTGSRYLLILSPGPDAPEPADAYWLAERQQEWRAAIEDLDRVMAICRDDPTPRSQR
jgi:hypothetical protein